MADKVITQDTNKFPKVGRRWRSVTDHTKMSKSPETQAGGDLKPEVMKYLYRRKGWTPRSFPNPSQPGHLPSPSFRAQRSREC